MSVVQILLSLSGRECIESAFVPPTRKLLGVWAATVLVGLSLTSPANSQMGIGIPQATKRINAAEAVLPALQPNQGGALSATITLKANTLKVIADNSSLEEIVRTVARLGHLKVTGEVRDERVYGVYGAGDLSVILSELLAGTGTNVIVKRGARLSGEIVLTARIGEATRARGSSRNADSTSINVAPFMGLEAAYRARPTDFNESVRPPDSVPNSAGPIPVSLPGAAPTPITVATQQRSPNGIKTPAEIQEGLLKLAVVEDARSDRREGAVSQ